MSNNSALSTQHSALYLVGNAHLDPAWMWRMEEGFEAFLATCRSALARMKETPGFIFTASSASYYEFVERTDSHLFSRIQEAVKNGRWSIVGGWWVESDCNLPGGEAFIRQGLYGQKYFESRFGKKCLTGYCIDSFGHNANLPQLLRHCGMTRYVFMRPEEHEKHLTDALFKWKSPNEDEVIAYRLPLHYSNHKHSVKEKLESLKSYSFYKEDYPWMIFYGVGNHGGGPTKEQIAQIISAQSSGNNIHFASPDDFFDAVEKSNLPIIADEMQPHAIGCYSAHSEIKKLNRRTEHALLRAEKLLLMAEVHLPDYHADWKRIDEAWKNLLFNNFHDILGGIAIKEAYDDAIAMYHESVAIAGKQERKAIQVLANGINTSGSIENLLLFNPHPWKMRSPIEFELWHPDASEKSEALESILITDTEDHVYLAQKIEASGKIGGDRVRFAIDGAIPGYGWSKLKIERNVTQPKVKSSIKASVKKLSNEFCGIVFDGIPGKNEIAYSPAQVFVDGSDTWGHGITGFTEKKGLFKIEKITVIEKGPVRGRVRVI